MLIFSRLLVVFLAFFVGIVSFNIAPKHEDQKETPREIEAKTPPKEINKRIVSVYFIERPFSENTIGIGLILVASKPYAEFSNDETRYLSLALSKSIENYLRPHNSDVILQEIEDVIERGDGQYVIEVKNYLYIEPGPRTKNASDIYKHLEEHLKLESDTWTIIDSINFQSPPIP